MILTSIAFYVFALILLASAAMVVSARNPVHSVLFLILAFFNAAALFLIAGAEFLAMILVIVYVGAVAVLFLFVVMMLDVNFSELREGFQRYAPIGLTVGRVLGVELLVVLTGWKLAPEAGALRMSATPGGLHNTNALGMLVYTDYVLLFQLAGLILLVSMIGAIVLTHRDRHIARRQSITVQETRTLAETLEMVRAPLGEGVTTILRPKPKQLIQADHRHADDADHGHPEDAHEPVHGGGDAGTGEHG